MRLFDRKLKFTKDCHSHAAVSLQNSLILIELVFLGSGGKTSSVLPNTYTLL